MTNEYDEYRRKLIIKLTALMAVLEVAVGKINHAAEQPGANVERLNKIASNLENTHEICKRALKTLEGKTARPTQKTTPSGLREYTELSGIGEYQKFKTMPAITGDDIATTDLDDLIGKLLS